MGTAWLKEERGLFIFYFCIQMRGGGVIGEGLKRRDKYRNCSTSISSSPFPNMLQERGQPQGLKQGLQGRFIECYVPGNME